MRDEKVEKYGVMKMKNAPFSITKDALHECLRYFILSLVYDKIVS